MVDVHCSKPVAAIVLMGYVIFSLLIGCVNADVTVETAFQNRNVIEHQLPAEYHEQIRAAKKKITCPGSMVYFYLHNNGPKPVSLDSMRWNGGDLKAHTDSYQAIWYRLMPDPIAPAGVGEIALCLRTTLTEPTTFSISLTDGTGIDAVVDPRPRAFRIQALRFSSALDTAYIYIRRVQPSAALPEVIHVNRTRMTDQVRWLNDKYCNDLRVAVVSFANPLVRGSIQTFRVTSKDGSAVDATTWLSYYGFSRRLAVSKTWLY